MVIRISSQINPRRRRARDAIKRKLTEGIESICSRTRYQENKMKQPFSCQLFQVSFTQKIGGNNTCTRHSHTQDSLTLVVDEDEREGRASFWNRVCFLVPSKNSMVDCLPIHHHIHSTHRWFPSPADLSPYPVKEKSLFLCCSQQFLSPESTQALSLPSSSFWTFFSSVCIMILENKSFYSTSCPSSSQDISFPTEIACQFLEDKREKVWQESFDESFSSSYSSSYSSYPSSCVSWHTPWSHVILSPPLMLDNDCQDNVLLIRIHVSLPRERLRRVHPNDSDWHSFPVKEKRYNDSEEASCQSMYEGNEEVSQGCICSTSHCFQWNRENAFFLQSCLINCFLICRFLFIRIISIRPLYELLYNNRVE